MSEIIYRVEEYIFDDMEDVGKDEFAFNSSFDFAVVSSENLKDNYTLSDVIREAFVPDHLNHHGYDQVKNELEFAEIDCWGDFNYKDDIGDYQYLYDKKTNSYYWKLELDISYYTENPAYPFSEQIYVFYIEIHDPNKKQFFVNPGQD